MTLVIIIIALALIFDYINGFHDAANSIATVVSTKVLTPFQAVVWAAIFNVVAYFIFKDHAVANTISKTVNKEFITLPVIFAGLIAAIFWNLLTWWYGIPSSSSHTLIGGFAGAAIAHAISLKGMGYSWGKIVESSIILNTVLFIFLAPLIGMLISIFITIVTIMRNIWVRIALIAAVTFLTTLLFDKFETNKMDENLQKFLKVDKYKKEVKDNETKFALTPTDVKTKEDLATAKDKLEKALPNYNNILGLIKNFDKLGATEIAKQTTANGWLKDIEASRLKDDLRNANDYLILEAASNTDTAAKAQFAIAKDATEKYKDPLKKYFKKELSLDSTIVALNAIYPIKDINIEKIKKKISGFSIEKALAKEFKRLEKLMLDHARNLEFEQAAAARDALKALKDRVLLSGA